MTVNIFTSYAAHPLRPSQAPGEEDTGCQASRKERAERHQGRVVGARAQIFPCVERLMTLHTQAEA